MPTSSAKPPIEVIAGPPHSKKTARVIDAFRGCIEAGEDAVLILPTAHAAASLRTALLLDGTFECLAGPRILTFTQFAEAVLCGRRLRVRRIDPMLQDALLASIVRDLADEGKLSYHAHVSNLPGFVRAVRALIMELKRGEITPEAFARFAGRRSAPAKDRELSAVYSRYQEILERRDLYDAEGRFWRARLLVSAGKLGPFSALARLFLDGFYDFTPAQLGLMEALATRGVQLTMTLPLEEPGGREELFESPRATLAKLKGRFAPTVQVLPGQALAEPALGWLTEHLFRSDVPADAPAPTSVRLIEAPGTESELREIAREIKRLHVEEEIPLEQFAVVFRTLGDYREVVEDVFAEFGLPVHIGGGVRLAHTPVGQLVLHMLRVPADGWHSRDVMSLLKSNYVCASAVGLADEELSLARFEELLTEAGTVRGRKSWVRNLRALRERIASRLASAEADLDDEVRDRTDAAELECKCRDLEEAETVSGKLFELFSGLELAETPDALVRALLDLLGRFEVEENIRRAAGEERAARDLEALAAVRECLKDLVHTASVLEQTRCRLGDFTENVAMVFGEKVVSRRGVDFGRVRVSAALAVRALSFDVVFIAGLLERSFPRMHREGPFYDDEERTRMSKRGLDVQPRRLSQREERFLFYLAATRAKKRLYLSYPVTDREGKEKLVSYYVGEVRRIFLPHEPSCRKVTLSTRVVGLGESASVRELRRAAVLALSEPRLSEPAMLARAAALLAKDDRRTALVLKRGIEGEAERDSWKPFAVHDGVLAHPEALERLAGRFGPDHPFSVTRLEEYGGCPFAFFCRSVLNIEPPAEPPEELEAVDEGIILHRTLRQFYSERRRRAGDTRIGADEIDQASSRIASILDAHLERFRERSPDLNEGLLKLQRQRMRELVAGFVRAEVENARKDPFDMIPGSFEVAFGLDVNPKAANPLSRADRLVIEIEGGPAVGIVGKIDRIDVTGEVVAEGRKRGFRVIDYKRGESLVAARDIEDGTALQMPVYLLAARDVLFAGEDVEPVDAQVYVLRRMRPKTVIRRLKHTKAGVEQAEDWDGLMACVVAAVGAHVSAIRRGEFPVLRRGRAPCPGYCDFRTICRYSEWRARKKLGEAKPWFETKRTDAEKKAKTDE